MRRLYARFLAAKRHAHYAGLVPNLPGIVVGFTLAMVFVSTVLVDSLNAYGNAIEQGVRQVCAEIRR